jgi:phage shock protein A
MGDVGLAIQRAEEKTENMKARAGAIDELLASGALEDYSGPRDDIQAELDRVGATGPGVDLELEQMKAELGMGSAPKELDAAPGQQQGQAQQAQPHQAPRPQQPGEGQ